MKRLFVLVILCLAFHLQGQEALSTNAAALPRPVYRYLFLIDTSSAMSRQKAVTADTVSRMIVSGIGGRIQSGDAWNLWTIDDQLHTNAIPAQRWDPQRRAELSNRIFRFLRAQRFNKKKAALEKSLAAVAEEAKLSGALTVFLFTDGSKPVKGTPFDESINEIFAKHAAGMRKAKKPFVTVFVAQDGRFAAHAVSSGTDRMIYIPPLPHAVASAKKSGAAARENAATVPPAPAKTLTAEEISEVLRQSQKRQSNTVAMTPATLIIRGGASQTNLLAAETSNKAAVETLGRTPTASVPASDTTASPDRSAVVSKAPTAIAPASPVITEPSASTGENASAPGDTIVPPPPPKDRLPVATTETAVGDTREALAPSPSSAQTAVLAQQEPPSNAPNYLMAAVALLLVALILGWLCVRSIRYVPRPSLISRSMEKEKK